MRTPQAVRLRVSRWRDPRLLIGLLLIGSAAVGGARVVAASDNTVAFWSLDAPVRAGDPVTDEQLTVSHIKLEGKSAMSYVAVDDEWPSDLAELTWAHDVDSGMLVARSSLELTARQQGGELPLMVESGSLPDDLARGDLVDVWVASDGAGAATEAMQVLSAARVLSSGDDPSALGGTPSRTVLIDAGSDIDGRLIGAVASGHITLIRVS